MELQTTQSARQLVASRQPAPDDDEHLLEEKDILDDSDGDEIPWQPSQNGTNSKTSRSNNIVVAQADLATDQLHPPVLNDCDHSPQRRSSMDATTPSHSVEKAGFVTAVKDWFSGLIGSNGSPPKCPTEDSKDRAGKTRKTESGSDNSHDGGGQKGCGKGLRQKRRPVSKGRIKWAIEDTSKEGTEKSESKPSEGLGGGTINGLENISGKPKSTGGPRLEGARKVKSNAGNAKRTKLDHGSEDEQTSNSEGESEDTTTKEAFGRKEMFENPEVTWGDEIIATYSRRGQQKLASKETRAGQLEDPKAKERQSLEDAATKAGIKPGDKSQSGRNGKGLGKRIRGNENEAEEETGGHLEELDDIRASQSPVCGFCGLAGNSKVAGRMVRVENGGARIVRGSGGHRVQMAGDYVHEDCLEWAPEVYFEGEKVRNLRAELNRAHRLKCAVCSLKGAALGCCVPKCRRSYHYACAKSLPECLWNEENFIMLCPEHASGGFPGEVLPGEGGKDGQLEEPKESAGQPSAKTKSKVPSAILGVALALPKWPPGPASKWVLCCSGLDAAGREKLSRFTTMAGATLVKQWTPAVTHMVTGLDEKGRARRTLKFLSAILRGQWIVTLDWLDACQEAGEAVKEGPFEVDKDVHDMEDGPRRGRLFAKEASFGLFEGMRAYFSGEFEAPSKTDLATVFLVGGGTVLHRRPLPLSPPNESSKGVLPAPTRRLVVLYSDSVPSADVISQRKMVEARREEAEALASQVGAVVHPHTWLLDSAARCQLLGMET